MASTIKGGPRCGAWCFSLALAAAAAGTLVLSGCNDNEVQDAGGDTAATGLNCDATMKTRFVPDANTTVIAVKSFKAGDPLVLDASAATASTPVAGNDLCLVKLNVGPGHAGPAGAPSTSAGIGMEIWLPAPSNWNRRIHNIGGGGWQGGAYDDPTQIASAGGVPSAATIAASEGAVVGTTDTGHAVQDGSFAMNPDGTIDTTLWNDFAQRSLHELALKTKALAAAYYAAPQKYAYWDGCSTGGRQGYNEVQNNPSDYDGYLNGAPAFNWSKFITGELYPQIVAQSDLGGVTLTDAQQALLSGAAVSACDSVGGQHLGYLMDPAQCRYDPTQDATVLCSGVTIGAVTGTNATAACVTAAQATAMNKTWYGMTRDGSVPSPAADTGTATSLAANQLWFGLMRGTGTGALAGASPFSISTDLVALELQDPTIAGTNFRNATGNGANKWRGLGYAGLANAYDQGLSLQPSFGNINTDNPDLSGLVRAGAKVLHYHGLADPLITPSGSINYYERVAARMGGIPAVQQVDRLFLVPGMGHCSGYGGVNGTAGPAQTANTVPLPHADRQDLYARLVDWVENGNAPTRIDLTSADGSASQPVCMYPTKATYNGSGSIKDAANYACK
ncbi:tannase/feruloyl esterase family alpha/beta hydrolase [Burkholderia sp. Bp9017]|uniref:tannase/feruloyl esterase family alpha/beta hydrolase n=1 Tax=Burkholderia TaxID=32008 RepID=UPI000F5E0A60|nr:tannase/feruloyl esterase family alpha/beta hydrolase [Burkholderia anthina]RQZ21348.1 tannase/feruloyl esterase family alpha/beta hydrolase [Burkholderia sp. Bp9017]